MWVEVEWNSGDHDIYAQRYSHNGDAVGTNFRVTNTSKRNQQSPDVRLWNNRIYSTWTDNRASGTGNDIWANVLDWENPTRISDKKLSQVPSLFILNQNCPNPFNAETTIRFLLPEASYVVIRIFNMLGNEVRTLINGQNQAGFHSVCWDGKDMNGNQVSSGVYLYRLESDTFNQTRKCLLLK